MNINNFGRTSFVNWTEAELRQERQEMTDPKTLARTKNPKTPKDAAKKIVKSGALSRQEKWVYDTIVRYLKYEPDLRQRKDFTTKDIAGWTDKYSYDKAYDICRKRFSGLEWKNKIVTIWISTNKKTGRNIYKRRDGCRVWRLK